METSPPLLRKSVSAIGVVGELHQPIAVVDADRHLPQRSDADKSSYLHIQIFAQPGRLKRNHAIHFLRDVGKPEGDVVRGVNLVYFAAYSMDNEVVLSMHLRDLARNLGSYRGSKCSRVHNEKFGRTV